MYELVELVRQRTAHLPDVKVVGYGHVGDGNLHLNISAPGGYSSKLEQLLEPLCMSGQHHRMAASVQSMG